MEKFTGKLVITAGEKFIGEAVGEVDALAVLEEFLDDLDANGGDANAWMERYGDDIHVYATLKDWTPEFVAKPGELDLESLSENTPNVYELEVVSGELYGESFIDEDELADRVKEMYKVGQMDIEDIRNMEVRRILHEDTSFEFAEEGERVVEFGDEYTVAVQEMRLHTGSEYIRTSDVKDFMAEELAKNPETVQASIDAEPLTAEVVEDVPPQDMSIGQIDSELARIEEELDKLQSRKYALKNEKQIRSEPY